MNTSVSLPTPELETQTPDNPDSVVTPPADEPDDGPVDWVEFDAGCGTATFFLPRSGNKNVAQFSNVLKNSVVT